MSEWQPIKAYQGKYEVSDTGLIRRADGKPLNPWPNDQGYLVVRLSGPRKMLRVHRLVAQAFIRNPKGLPAVNHIDHNRQNNAVSNLEWCTQKQNLAHADNAGRLKRDNRKGQRSPNAKLTNSIVLMIRCLYATGDYSFNDLAKNYEISKRAIGRIVHRETYADV